MKAWLVELCHNDEIPEPSERELYHKSPPVVGIPQFQLDCLWLSILSFESAEDCKSKAECVVKSVLTHKANGVDDWAICENLQQEFR